MLKKFFISMLGTIAGLWIAAILLFFTGLVALGIAMGKSDESTNVKDKSILYLNLSGEIIERSQSESFMTMIQNFENEPQTLEDMLKAVRLAADDKKIEGIYINAAGSSMGIASREELAEALAAFKESGKWVYAYADNYAQGDYLLSTFADKVYLNPVGNVDIRGIGTSTPFFTGLLDKLGIKVQVVKVGTYKSAVEPFILTSMSEAARRQNQVFVDSIWDYYSNTVAANRSVTTATVSAWADSLTFAWTADHDVDAGIVTEKRYRREVEDMLRDLTGVDAGKSLRLVTPKNYVASRSGDLGDSSGDHIAVLYAVGDIVDSGDEGIVGQTIVPQIIGLADNEKVSGLVLRVNSPGGSAFASEQIWEALNYFKSKGKPFYVSMGDYAASGGYYISCGADCIYADATTLTGSIGVFGMIPDFSGLVTGKLGVTFSDVSSSPNANFMSLMQPLTEQQRASMQRYVEDTYDVFTGRVAEGRHMSVDSVKAIAEGRVWIGSSAVELGLVDHIGSLHACIEAIADSLGMEPSQCVSYPDVSQDFMKKLLEESQRLESAAGVVLDREAIAAMMAVKRLREMNPVQARMPDLVIR